ncbi:MAG: hypothetical protein QOE28_2030, partial [Solirubrobacteraceae bacterium]|nr:hypothetical protein [Solirubrobacteraceae bacterium]
VLASAGFRRLVSPGHRRHRFFLAFDGERARWLKIDVSLVPARLEWDLEATDPRSLERFAAYRVGTKSDPGALERAWAWVEQRRPLGVRRQGPIVAVLGPDGAGKGSVIAAVRREIPAGTKALYLGHGEISRAEYGRPRGERPLLRRAVKAPLSLLPGELRMTQYRARRALGLAARAWAAYAYAWRGDVVVCDRHPLEALAVDAADRTLGAVVERRLLAALVRPPDAVVLLDAPGEVLFARKGEHSPELLDRQRAALREAFDGDATTVVSTTSGLEHSVAEASAALWRALGRRRGW